MPTLELITSDDLRTQARLLECSIQRARRMNNWQLVRTLTKKLESTHDELMRQQERN